MLERLGIRDFRNLAEVELETTGRVLLVHGPNGSGKTSLLEAIHYLATGRSFRTHLVEPLIRSACTRFVLRADLRCDDRTTHRLGLERSRRQVRRRLDGEDQRSQLPLSRLFPVLAIHPDTHLLVSGSPSLRRRFMDWGCFHHDEAFAGLWSRYARLARHRAQLLRGHAPSAEIRAIDQTMVPLADGLHQARLQFLSRFVPVWQAHLDQFSRDLPPDLELVYLRGWGEELSFVDSLSLNLTRDRRLGRTTAGPHRASFHLLVGGQPAGRVLSRGQQKLLAIALAIAQASLLTQARDRAPLLLIDDLASELDRHHIEKVASHLSSLPSQVVLTAVDPRAFEQSGIRPERVFHVKHGEVEEDDIMPYP